MWRGRILSTVPDPVPRRWPGATIALIAPGPSLTGRDVKLISAAADRMIAVGDAYRLAWRADVLYHADEKWWEHHEGAPGFAGERWAPDERGFSAGVLMPSRAIAAYGLRAVRVQRRPGLSLDAAFVHSGHNSGFQALNLAVLFGAARILLLGFDMMGTHFFGPHPKALRQRRDYAPFIAAFEAAAPQLRALCIEVVNCTRETALTCFPLAAVEEMHAPA